MAGKRRIEEKSPGKKVTFAFMAPEAKSVYLAGDFNDWNPSRNRMKKDETGEWKAAVSLRPGRYEYRFVVDGSWESDPVCPSRVPNDFGGENCVRIVE